MTSKDPSVNIKDWVQLYSDKLFSWALYKIGSKEDAEDLVQETFLIAINSLQKFEGRSEPDTWLFGILNNKIAGYFRDAYKSPVSNSSSIDDWLSTYFDEKGHWLKNQAPTEWVNDNSNLLDDSDFTKQLNDCMDKLPRQWQSAVQLKYLEEKKAAEICQELQVATTNYWQILHRAKLQLRKCLEIHWFKN